MVVMFISCGKVDDGSVTVDPNAIVPDTGDATAQESQENNGNAQTEQSDSLYYETNGVQIHTYDLADDVFASIGKANGTFEAPSCAYQGSDFFYYYDGFQLTVNEVDGADHVTIIMIVDDTVSIPQGVKIGDTKETMLQLMGDDYTDKNGLYEFVSGNTTLQIQVKENSVVSIMYVYTPQE
jgi:heme-binding NEAT domain protein